MTSEKWSTTLTRAVLAAVAIGIILFLILTCLGFSPRQMAAMFSHPVTGGTGPAPVEAAPEQRPPFGLANYAVLGVYLLGMLGIGWLASRRIKGARDFFIAGGRLNYVVVGISLLGTYLSALTVTALPGVAYGEHNWKYALQLPFLIITAVVITRLVLPRYRDAGVISVYEYLEQRIHVSARLIAAIGFIALSIGRMGLLLYLPALAFSTVTGVSLPLCIIVMGLFITIYTVMGGMEAVVWTDAVQVVIFVFAAFLTLGYVFHDIGVERFLQIGMQHNKFQLIDPSLDITRITTIWLILETIFQTIRIYGTQQDMTQRYMTTESTAKANRSVWISILAYVPLGFLFFFIGTALFVYYQVNPAAELPEKADKVYPFFMMHRFPPGLAGLLIAAIFAAAMSSIDSLMNSTSTVFVEDFLKRFGRHGETDAAYLRKARALTVLLGFVAVGMGLMFMGTQYAQIIWGRVMAVSTNGTLGLMALAFMPFRVNKWAAISGFCAATACLFILIAAGTSYLIWPVVGNTICFVVALVANPLFAAEAPAAAEGS